MPIWMLQFLKSTIESQKKTWPATDHFKELETNRPIAANLSRRRLTLSNPCNQSFHDGGNNLFVHLVDGEVALNQMNP